MEKTRVFSLTANPVRVFNDSSGAMVNGPESQQQALGGETDKAASVGQRELCSDFLMNLLKGRDEI